MPSKSDLRHASAQLASVLELIAAGAVTASPGMVARLQGAHLALAAAGTPQARGTPRRAGRASVYRALAVAAPPAAGTTTPPPPQEEAA